MQEQDRLVTRNEVRQMGLNVTSTQFGRYEDQGLLDPIKIGDLRSARVHYKLSQVQKLLTPRNHRR